MEIVQGKRISSLSQAQFSTLVASYREIWLDIGTGDGLFVYRTALEHPEILCIGIEPAWRNLSAVSNKALRKPTRGGTPNALFVAASIEDPPDLLNNMASRITINYPWGSLLRGLIRPEPLILANIRRLARFNASVELLLNYSVFTEAELLTTLDLPDLTDEYLNNILVPAYQSAGIVIIEHELIAGRTSVRTTWGQHLTLGSKRQTLSIRAKAI